MAGYADSCARTWRALAVAALAVTAATAAQAGSITTNEGGMDSIYSQSSFGANTVDIRFDAPRTIYRSDLTSIDSGDFEKLPSEIVNLYPVVSMFFVDSINFCDGTGSYLGCSSLTGNIVAVNSFSAASSSGATLLAHELGHNLRLDHLNNSSNLMNPSVPNGGLLNSTQVEFLLGSGLIRTDGLGQRYIEIAPIAVVASVPEAPTSLMLSFGLALAALGARRSRRRLEA